MKCSVELIGVVELKSKLSTQTVGWSFRLALGRACSISTIKRWAFLLRRLNRVHSEIILGKRQKIAVRWKALQPSKSPATNSVQHTLKTSSTDVQAGRVYSRKQSIEPLSRACQTYRLFADAILFISYQLAQWFGFYGLKVTLFYVLTPID